MDRTLSQIDPNNNGASVEDVIILGVDPIRHMVDFAIDLIDNEMKSNAFPGSELSFIAHDLRDRLDTMEEVLERFREFYFRKAKEATA
jgi:hypothetical protein